MSGLQYGSLHDVPCVWTKGVAWLWHQRGAWRPVIEGEVPDVFLWLKEINGQRHVREQGWVRATEQLAAQIAAHAEPIDRLGFFWKYDIAPPPGDRLPRVVWAKIESEGEAAVASGARCPYRSKVRESAWKAGWRRAAEKAGIWRRKHPELHRKRPDAA
jgi:hypothetical protein